MLVHKCGATQNDQIITPIQEFLGQGGGTGHAVLGAAEDNWIILFECFGRILKGNYINFIAVRLQSGNNDAVIVVVKGMNQGTF